MQILEQLSGSVSIVKTADGVICLNTGNEQPLSRHFESVEAARRFWTLMRDVDFFPSWEERAWKYELQDVS